MYPVSLDIRGKLCVIIGGGSVASRKAEGLLAAGATVRIISPVVVEQIFSLAEKGALQWLEKQYEAGDLQGAMLVFAATDKPKVQHAVRVEAEKMGQLMNIADAPGNCSFQVPASIRQGDLLVTVSTNGKSPAVAAMIRRKLEQDFGPEYQQLLQLMTVVRAKILAGKGTAAQKKLLAENVLDDNLIDWIKSGKTDAIQNHLQSVLGADNIPELNVMRAE